MIWQTKTSIPNFPVSLLLNRPLLFLGSCFAENIGLRIQQHFLPCTVNPFGITFNPLALKNTVMRWRQNYQYSKSDLHSNNGLYFSYDHHSRFSHSSPDRVLQNISLSLEDANQKFQDTQAVFISLGTSFYWELKTEKRIVNNCHKIPAKEFDLKMASIPEITDALKSTVGILRHENPLLPVIFTVSPVRHLKHGAVDNQRSKARLIEAVHQICDTDDNVHYFPSYELLLDDLRDYRFYDRDLVHPNEQAIDYIFEKFCLAFYNEQNQKVLEKLHKLHLSLNHRFLTDNLTERNKFIQNTEEKILQLEGEAGLDLSRAKSVLQSK